MLETQIHREYVRTDSWSVIAKVSRDDATEKWYVVQIPNIAAGGLLFRADTTFEEGEVLIIDMQIDPLAPGITGKIPMKVKGVVKGDRGMIDGLHAYSIVFTEISSSDRIRLDELVRMTNYKFQMESESSIFDR